jgi:hypothetical protein
MTFSTATFLYRTCANGADHKGAGYHVDGPDGKLYSVLFLSRVQQGASPIRYEINGAPSNRVRLHVDIESHYKLPLESFRTPCGHTV